MSFLDNLENTLKNMESSLEKDPEALRREAEEREARRAAALAAAPYVESLRTSKWTQDLLAQCVAIGHGMRTRVGMVWVGDTLRLDAKEKRLELQPGPNGIDLVFFVGGSETGREAADLGSDPTALARRWLQS